MSIPYFLAFACPTGGCVPGSRAVTYYPFPQCCQLVSQGNCDLAYSRLTFTPISEFLIPYRQGPSLSGAMSIKATASPAPLCSSSGRLHFLKSLDPLSI